MGDVDMKFPVLVVDDEETLRSVITQVLSDDGYQVVAAASGEEALEIFRANPVPLVITDIVMRKMSGLELLQEIKLIAPETLVVIMTSHGSLDTATSALRSGAYDFLIKPFEDIDLISALVKRAAEKIRLTDNNRELVGALRKKAEELESVNATLRELADRDGLTNLHNHRFFRDALAREVARSGRHKRVFSLILMDVDHFKQYNDTYGHLVGDLALKLVAETLQKIIRATTVAARYGGEEFVLIVPEVGREGAWCVVAERVRQAIEARTFDVPESSLSTRLTVSLGVACFPEDGGDATAIIDAADKALYQAKAAGRNCVCHSAMTTA